LEATTTRVASTIRRAGQYAQMLRKINDLMVRPGFGSTGTPSTPKTYQCDPIRPKVQFVTYLYQIAPKLLRKFFFVWNYQPRYLEPSLRGLQPSRIRDGPKRGLFPSPKGIFLGVTGGQGADRSGDAGRAVDDGGNAVVLVGHADNYLVRPLRSVLMGAADVPLHRRGVVSRGTRAGDGVVAPVDGD